MSKEEARAAAAQAKREGKAHGYRMKAQRCRSNADTLSTTASARRARAALTNNDAARQRIESVADSLEQRASTKHNEAATWEQRASSV